MKPHLRIVVVTNLWPSRRRPAWGCFVANRVEALRQLGHDVEVVAVEDHPSAARRYASLLAGVGRAALSRRPVQPTVVEAHIAYPTGPLAWPLAVRLGAPLVLFAHGSDVLRLPDRSPVDRALCRFVFGRASLVVANSTFLAGEVERRLGVPPERVALVSPGIRYADFAAAREAVRREDHLLFVANLIPRKGLDVLLDALAELGRRSEEVPPLRVVGDGPERATLEEQARRTGARVEFVGALPQERVAAEMAAAEILVVPSREEALGLAPLEAMAAGCVPVVSGIGGLAESVTDGVTGFTCRPEDPGDLADALVRALNAVRDADRRAALVRAGDEVARQHDMVAAAERTVHHYVSLLGLPAATRHQVAG
ncbi:glycosyltransferase [Thermasporomyces composti]|uniref:Glycogen(Starch) synthase n=1 Tax=Thermasporomyces composti TaxID=696763 RepID=A0A3D9V5A9_THECX|nr:glycosyltransferase [Thermasporomyces composti]REF36556.1 glycogen(starch) synthase [Thermasporomyces composti]